MSCLSPLLIPEHKRPNPLRLQSDRTGIERDRSGLSQINSTHKPFTRQLEALDIPITPTSTPLRRATQQAKHLTLNHVKYCLSSNGINTPPATPPNRSASSSISSVDEPETPLALEEETTALTFDLDQGEVIGLGLWSKVYRVEDHHDLSSGSSILTPPTTPGKLHPAPQPQVYAVKVAARADAAHVFEEESMILSHLQSSPDADQYIVPFYGPTNIASSPALIFAYASGGTLEDLSQRLDIDLAISYYPQITTQLVSGLCFLHSSGVVHADIKPANILLDFCAWNPSQLLSARFCDFSASISAPEPVHLVAPPSPLPTSPISAPPSPTNSQRSTGMGGGTWGFMAPEQLSSNSATNGPCYATDVYSLGMTLLTFLLGGQSPFIDLEGNNLFMFREGIKMGDPFQFARNAGAHVRAFSALDASETGKLAITSLKLALKKKAADRVPADEWRTWCLEAGWRQ